ncbi:MAG: dihydroxyacetone kinase subunit DhaK [Rhizobiaceae bacterium]|nr:dihydroxyacetone kinase subunit DhaK [Rhizobiaceae bacterium]
MSKLMNDPRDYVDEMLDGLVLAHPSLARHGAGGRVIRRTDGPKADKVGIVSGGGSGHLPLFTGYVGPGLLDACSVGNVFEGPNVASCSEAIAVANTGKGVLCLYGNYGGDRMNFDMACEMADMEGIETATVLGTDDIASAGTDQIGRRRGVAGIVYAYKAAGAAADAGGNLGDVTEVARRTVESTRTLGFALAPCTVPGAAGPTFELPDGNVEMGMGIHGEPGIWRDSMKPTDTLADEMVERLLENAPVGAGNRVSVLVNSLGATPLEELYILYRRTAKQLAAAGIEIATSLVGRYTTSMEMAGASLTLCFLDEEIGRLLKAPAECPFWSVRP